MARPNQTQRALDSAREEQAYWGQVAALDARQAIRPLERRRLHRLAAFIALTPICRREA